MSAILDQLEEIRRELNFADEQPEQYERLRSHAIWAKAWGESLLAEIEQLQARVQSQEEAGVRLVDGYTHAMAAKSQELNDVRCQLLDALAVNEKALAEAEAAHAECDALKEELLCDVCGDPVTIKELRSQLAEKQAECKELRDELAELWSNLEGYD